MGRSIRPVCLLPLILGCAFAQDERRIQSPDGTLEFRLFVTPTEPGALSRLAYQVWLRGQPLIRTSFLGLEIVGQEPVLGCNVGLTGSRIAGEAGAYRSLIAEYMQNGSIGRRINLEVRVWNDGLAFRCVVPNSTALSKILVRDELTEFNFANVVAASRKVLPMPLVVEQPGVGWVAIAESQAGTYPRASLVPDTQTRMVTRLAGAAGDNTPVFEAAAPWIGPWRAVWIGSDRNRLLDAISAHEFGR
jgi:hypothetical protein